MLMAILTELGLDRIAVWGFSGGGPYAAHFPADEDHTTIEDNNRGAAFTWPRSQVG